MYAGWQIAQGQGGQGGRRQADKVELLTKRQLEAKLAPPVSSVVRDLDLAGLMGIVRARDGAAAAYFGHFNALLHLEYLVELEDMRRRVLRRPLDALVKSGWALGGLRVSPARMQSCSRHAYMHATYSRVGVMHACMHACTQTYIHKHMHTRIHTYR